MRGAEVSSFRSRTRFLRLSTRWPKLRADTIRRTVLTVVALSLSPRILTVNVLPDIVASISIDTQIRSFNEFFEPFAVPAFPPPLADFTLLGGHARYLNLGLDQIPGILHLITGIGARLASVSDARTFRTFRSSLIAANVPNSVGWISVAQEQATVAGISKRHCLWKL